MFNKSIVSSSFAIAVAIVTAAALLQPARAADAVKSPRDSASGQASGKMQSNSHTRFDPLLIEGYDDILGSIAALRDQVSALSAKLDAQLSLAGEADDAAVADATEVQGALTELESAQRVFDDQVSALLDPATAAQVLKELEALRQTYTATGNFSDGSSRPLSEEAAQVIHALEGIEELLVPLEDAAKQGKSTPVTRSNISNN